MDAPLRLRELVAWLNTLIATLYPGCFAFVMATGIISNAMMIEGHRGWSDALFVVNLIAYPWLLLLTLVRVVRFWPNLQADLTNPRLIFSFFTLVAGTAVFGLGMHLRGDVTTAAVLWIVALILWLVLIYFSFGLLIFMKAQGVKVVHGAWLNAIVGTESLVLLGAAVAHAFGGLSPTIFVFSHWLWGIGLGLYAIFITLLGYHLFFFDVEPDDLTPLLWIVMGAAAISTNAGSVLILADSGMPFLDSTRPFIDGVTLLMWAWGTWWIPLLLLLGLWKHGIRRVPLTYTPVLWSLVFSSWDVCHRHSESLTCGRPPATSLGFIGHGVGGARRLGSDGLGPSQGVVAKPLAPGGQLMMVRRFQPTAFLLDLDGTLVDGVYAHVLAWHEALNAEGKRLAIFAALAYLGERDYTWIGAKGRSRSPYAE